MAVTREQKTNSSLKQLLAPVAVNANRADIPALDVSGFESALFTVTVGAAAVEPSNDNNLRVTLKHSDDNVNFDDCAKSEVIGVAAGAADGTFAVINAAPDANTAFMAGYIGSKRYVKPVIQAAGNLGDGVLLSIAAVLHNPKYRPVA